jgi:NDP-hexose 2,3-dehydratase
VHEPGLDPDGSRRRFPRSGCIAETWQSDEGGRFYRSVSVYRLTMVNDPSPETPREVHLTLGEVEGLLPLGAFTNESRSVLALLLPSF